VVKFLTEIINGGTDAGKRLNENFKKRRTGVRFIKSRCIKKHIMSRRLIEIFLLILLFGCSSKSPTLHDSFKGHSLTKFCDLPKYEGKEIFTRAYYIGSQEYWSLFSPDSCNNGYGVNLEFKDDNTTSKFQADLKKAIYNERSEG